MLLMMLMLVNGSTLRNRAYGQGITPLTLMLLNTALHYNVVPEQTEDVMTPGFDQLY